MALARTGVDNLPPYHGATTSLMRMNPRKLSLPGGLLNKEGHGGGSTRAKTNASFGAVLAVVGFVRAGT